MFFEDFEMKMNEEFFMGLQQFNPWFNGDLFLSRTEPLEKEVVNKNKTFNDLANNDVTSFDIKRIIFAKIFGKNDDTINLDEAENICLEILKVLAKRKPQKFDVKDRDIVLWLYEYASINILLGTVYAYKKEYVKSAYHFIAGIKKEAVNLNAPYSDFIKYVFSKLETEKKQKANYKGKGFSVEDFAGIKIEKEDDRIFVPYFAESLVSKMEGEKGEMVVAYRGRRSMFGCFNRLGSTLDKNTNTHIDKYETFLIDKDYKLKEIVFYFSNYIRKNGKNEDYVLPEGFVIEPIEE